MIAARIREVWPHLYSRFGDGNYRHITNLGSIQFRGEIFSLPNIFDLGQPFAYINSPTFGKITFSGAPRLVQFALRYDFLFI